MESAEMISALKRRASSTDNLVLPVPVDPSITINGTFLNIILLFHFLFRFCAREQFCTNQINEHFMHCKFAEWNSTNFRLHYGSFLISF